MTKPLIRLTRLLAQLYPDATLSSYVMAAAGIQSGRILSEQSPNTRWFFIVSEADKAGLIPQLMATVAEDYPDHAELRSLRAELGSVTAQERLSVLAIWPHTPGQQLLDHEGEGAAIYAVGLDYIELSGAGATRDAVVREWARVKPDIVVIGAHGLDGEIYLSDGTSRIGWWQRLVRRHAPQLVLLMACESSTSAHFDIPDAFVRAGVGNVIAIDDKILDTDAVQFERVFFENYMAPMPVADAVDIAKSTLSDKGAAMIRLLEAT